LCPYAMSLLNRMPHVAGAVGLASRIFWKKALAA
jgi:hypothetical protein